MTEAYSLEDAPLDGWKVWTGSFLEVEGFDVKCATCSTDIDCSVNRGTCNSAGRCKCEDGFDGQFCEADIPCDYVVNYSEGRASNKRQIYVLDLDGDEDEEDRKLDEKGERRRQRRRKCAMRSVKAEFFSNARICRNTMVRFEFCQD